MDLEKGESSLYGWEDHVILATKGSKLYFPSVIFNCFLSSLQTKTTTPPVSLYEKLLWREFFFAVGSQVPNAHEMVNNPVSLQIPWEDCAEYLERWKQVCKTLNLNVAENSRNVGNKGLPDSDTEFSISSPLGFLGKIIGLKQKLAFIFKAVFKFED